MKPVYLLDTDICIYVQRRRPPGALSRFQSLQNGEAAMSLISFGELMAGAAKSRDPIRSMSVVSRFAEQVPVLPLRLEAASHYATTRADLERRGMSIGAKDLWIAAHALALDLTLVTNNEREFCRVDGLRVENWAAA